MMKKMATAVILPAVLAVSACGGSSSGGASDVSWQDVLSKKVDATTACQDLLGARDADSTAKVAKAAMATPTSGAKVTGELTDADDATRTNLQCDIGGLATRFFPATEQAELTSEDSVVATGQGFAAESHAGQKGSGMLGVLTDAVQHLKD